MKVLFAESGSKDELLRTLGELEAQTLEALAVLELVAVEHAERAEPFPDRAHVNGLMLSFIWEQQRARAAWTAWALTHVEGWPDTHSPDDSATTHELFARIARGT